MVDLESMFQLQGMLFTLIFLGFFLRKRGMITQAHEGGLMDLIINVFLPCNILTSFQVEFDTTVLTRMEYSLILSTVVQLFCIGLSFLLYHKYANGQSAVLRYGTICSNGGFIGNAVVQGLYGSEGLLYASVFLVPLRICLWSVGLSLFTKQDSLKATVKKAVTHPCIVATLLGCVMMIAGVQLPGFLGTSVHMLGGCSTPVSLVLIGGLLAKVSLRTVVNKTTLKFCFFRLIFIPAVVLLGCQLLAVDPFLRDLAVVLAAMPAATVTAILAAKYQGDTDLATKTVMLSTLLSMPTLVLWTTVLLAV